MNRLMMAMGLLILASGGAVVAQSGTSTNSSGNLNRPMVEAPIGHRQPRTDEVPNEKNISDPNNPVKTDTINIPSSDTTLQQAASYINSGSYGVTASVVTDSTGSRLVFVSKTSGAAGNLNVSTSATRECSTDSSMTASDA